MRIDFSSGSAYYAPDMTTNGNYVTNAAGGGPVIAGGYAACSGNTYLGTWRTNLNDGLSQQTVTCWVRATATRADYPSICMHYNATAFTLGGLEFSTVASGQYIAQYSWGANQSAGSVTTGVWTYVAMRYIYLGDSGIQVGTTYTGGGYNGKNPLVVRSEWRLGPGLAPYTGTFDLDEVRIYNRGLTTNELEQVRLEGRP
jgi:hypothetical protein